MENLSMWFFCLYYQSIIFSSFHCDQHVQIIMLTGCSVKKDFPRRLLCNNKSLISTLHYCADLQGPTETFTCIVWTAKGGETF